MATEPASSIGMEQVDAEHALQVRLLREIETALAASKRETAQELMAQLQQFSEAHFASEQILMRLHSYPGYLEHERLHGELLERFTALAVRIASGADASLPAASSAVREWLTNHIGTADREFVEYLHAALPSAIAAPAAS